MNSKIKAQLLLHKGLKFVCAINNDIKKLALDFLINYKKKTHISIISVKILDLTRNGF